MTKQTTQEFVTARSKAILNEIKALREELAVLRTLKSNLSSPKNQIGTEKTSKSRSGLTFQDMIIEVLNDLPSGASESAQILALIEQKFGKRIQRASLSPQLSRLKMKGILVLKDGMWQLTPNHKSDKKNKTTSVAAEVVLGSATIADFV